MIPGGTPTSPLPLPVISPAVGVSLYIDKKKTPRIFLRDLYHPRAYDSILHKCTEWVKATTRCRVTQMPNKNASLPVPDTLGHSVAIVLSFPLGRVVRSQEKTVSERLLPGSRPKKAVLDCSFTAIYSACLFLCAAGEVKPATPLWADRRRQKNVPHAAPAAATAPAMTVTTICHKASSHLDSSSSSSEAATSLLSPGAGNR